MESIKVALLRLDAILSIFFVALKPSAHKFSASESDGVTPWRAQSAS
jgi:hypothetical protein